MSNIINILEIEKHTYVLHTGHDMNKCSDRNVESLTFLSFREIMTDRPTNRLVKRPNRWK